MPIVPLYGHAELRARLEDSIKRGALPAALLLQGPRGVGKQRLALWLAQLLLCDAKDGQPCGKCSHCHHASELRHPDVSWYFPRPRLKDSDPDVDDVRQDYAEAVAERAADGGLYAPPSGSDAIYIATVRAIVAQAVKSPALAKRKVFVIGDAERMVPQEGSEFAANAFLKLLEEPSADTQLILTSSEPGALLPTIRSRVSSVRVAPLSQDDMRQFLADTAVSARLDADDALPVKPAERIVLAGGAPGRLLAGAGWKVALDNARKLLDSVSSKPAAMYEAAWAQASSKARGNFADSLDALTVALHERTREAVRAGTERPALHAARAIDAVELAKERVLSNVSPQLVTMGLLRDLHELLA